MIQKTQKAVATLLTIFAIELIVMITSGYILIPLLIWCLVACGYALCLLNHRYE